MEMLKKVSFLSDDQLRRQAPSVFAQHKAPTRSEKYTYVPTDQIVNAMRKEGFFPIAASQSATRKQAHLGFTKHRVLFAREERIAQKGAHMPYISIVGSHDGSSCVEANAGCKVWRCDNGLIADDGSFGAFKVPHKGDILGNIIEGVYTILDSTHEMSEQLEYFQSLQMPRSLQLELAKEAIPLRWDARPDGTFGIQPEQLLVSRRPESRGDSLFDVFNNIQENVIREGVVRRSPTGRAIKSRTVKSVSEDQRLNKALWSLAAGAAQRFF